MQLVRAEFIATPPLCIAVAGAMIANGGWTSALIGAWLAGVGLNYFALAVFAIRFSRPQHLRAELEGIDPASELRRYSLYQMWILVPLALVVSSIFGARPCHSV